MERQSCVVMFGGGQPGQLIQQSFRPGSDPAQTVFFGPAGLGFCVVHPPDPNKTLGRGLPFWERYTNRFNLKAVKCMVAGPNLHSHLGQRGQDQLQQLNPRSHPAQRNKHRTSPVSPGPDGADIKRSTASKSQVAPGPTGQTQSQQQQLIPSLHPAQTAQT